MAKSIEELESEKSRLAEEMRQVDYELALRRGIPMTAEALKASRAYAFDAARPIDEVITRCSAAIERYGFCVVDNVIPSEHIEGIRIEAEKAETLVETNAHAVREGLKQGKSLHELAKEDGIELAQIRTGLSTKDSKYIIWFLSTQLFWRTQLYSNCESDFG